MHAPNSPRASRAVPLAGLMLLLGACAGGGGGGGGGGGTPGSGGGGTPATVAAVTTASPVLAPATAPAAPPAFTALLFPLYVVFPAWAGGSAPGTQVGTRTEDASGAITVTYQTTAGGRSVTFLPGDFTQRDSEAVAASSPGFDYGESWADNAAGFALQHMRVGVLQYPDQGTTIPVWFAFGHETPAANLPASGSATYSGQTAGYLWQPSGGSLIGSVLEGDIRVTANFATRNLTGTIDNLTTDAGSGAVALGHAFQVGGTIAPSATSIQIVSGTVTSTTLLGGGELEGRFFGPNANEVGGTWSYADSAGSLTIQAAFGARTDAPLQPDNTVAARRFAVTGGALPSGRDLDWLADTASRNTDVNLPQGFLRRLNTDGSMRVVFTDRTGATTRTITAGEFTRNIEAERTMRGTGFEYSEFGLSRADDAFADTGSLLTYARYGWRGTGATGSDSVNPSTQRGLDIDYIIDPLHFGAVTPAAVIGSGFRAEYTGVTRAVQLDGTHDAITGRFDITSRTELAGRVTMTADFGQGTLLGKLSGFSARDGGGTVTLADLTMVIDGTVAAAGGMLKLQGNLRQHGGTPMAGVLDGLLYGPNAEEAAGVWQAWGPVSATARYVLGSFGAGRGDAAGPDLLSWTFGGGPGYALSQSVTRIDTAADGTVTGDAAVGGITGTLTPRTDGGYVLALTDAGGTRTLTFLPGSQTTDPMAQRVAALSTNSDGNYRMSRLEAAGSDVELLAGRTWDLAYSRFGYWSEESNSGQTVTFGTFHAGAETPLAQVPAAGTAVYRGSTAGILFEGGVAARIFSPNLTLNADFGAHTITGSATEFGAVVLAGPDKDTARLPPFLKVEFNGTISGNAFSGSSASVVIAPTGTGTFEGKFYGPRALEAAGTWKVENATGSMKAWGSFGATR